MIFLISSFYLALCVIFTRLVRVYDSWISPVYFLGLSIFIYLIAIPLELQFIGMESIKLSGITVDFSYEMQSKVIFAGFIGYIVFFISYYLTINKNLRPSVEGFDLKGYENNISLLVIVFLSLLTMLLVGFGDLLINVRSYSGNIEASYSNPLYALIIKYLMIFYVIIILREAAQNKSIKFVGFFVRLSPLIAWSLYSNDKDPLMISFLAFLVLFLVKYKKFMNTLVMLFATIGIAVLIPVATIIFSLGRANAQLDILGYIERLGIFRNAEPAGPMFALVTSTGPGAFYTQELMARNSLIDAVLAWIPSFLWSDKPRDLAERFAMLYMPDWSPGRGYGFSFLAEGWLHFGELGVVIVFLLLGVFIGCLRNFIILVSRKIPVIVALYFVVLMYITFLSMRGSFYVLVNSSFQSIIVPVLIVLLVSRIRFRMM